MYAAIAIAALLTATVLIAGAARSLFRGWLELRVRVALLERLEKQPELLRSPEDVQALLAAPSQERPGRHSYILTGTLLALIGLTCIAIGWAMRIGQLAVGVYLGGYLCVAVGLVLLLLGLLVRMLARDRTAHLKEDVTG